MEANSVKETVEQLYALRAGLSAVAIEYDKAMEAKRNFDVFTHRTESRISEARSIFSGSKMHDAKHELARERENLETAKKLHRLKTIIPIIGVVLVLLFGAVGILCIAEDMICLGIFELICGCLASGMAMYGCYQKQKQKDHIGCWNYTHADMVEWEERIESAESSLPQTLASLKAEAERARTTLTELRQSMQADATKAAAEIRERSLQGLAMYDALVKTFSSILDERDWKNLDLVIYYLETGRALDIREALQQVDRQHQNDALVRVMQEAQSAISMSIQRSTFALAAMIQQSALQIQSAITFNTVVSGYANGYLVGAEAERMALTLETRAREALDTTLLQTALVEKSKASSEQLVQSTRSLHETIQQAASILELYDHPAEIEAHQEPRTNPQKFSFNKY